MKRWGLLGSLLLLPGCIIALEEDDGGHRPPRPQEFAGFETVRTETPERIAECHRAAKMLFESTGGWRIEDAKQDSDDKAWVRAWRSRTNTRAEVWMDRQHGKHKTYVRFTVSSKALTDYECRQIGEKLRDEFHAGLALMKK